MPTLPTREKPHVVSGVVKEGEASEDPSYGPRPTTSCLTDLDKILPFWMEIKIWSLLPHRVFARIK